jgi:hypothetical protein
VAPARRKGLRMGMAALKGLETRECPCGERYGGRWRGASVRALGVEKGRDGGMLRGVALNCISQAS